MWSDDTGRYSVEAELVDVTKDSVRLKRKDGKLITVARSRLSTADRDYLAKNLPAPGSQRPWVCTFSPMIVDSAHDGLVEISAGSDDGLRKGDKFEVVRRGDGSKSSYVGRIEVVEITTDHAVCRSDPKMLRSPIQRGDRVFDNPNLRRAQK
jgi:hypothetical protein